MRKENNKEYIVRDKEPFVITTTTGYIEADMLGHVLNVTEEMSAKQRSSQRPHRKNKEKTVKSDKSVSQLLQEGFEEEQAMYNLKWYQTAPTACLRSLNVLINKGKSAGRRVVSRVRKLFVND